MCNGFRPVPHYFPDGDFISFYWEPDECYASQVDYFLTVFYSMETGKIIGCQVNYAKNLACIFRCTTGLETVSIGALILMEEAINPSNKMNNPIYIEVIKKTKGAYVNIN